jgi:regulator of sigma E protease
MVTIMHFAFMIAAFIGCILILVFVHEYGHFSVARKLGVKCERFSIGFGRVLWKWTSPKDGVEYAIGAIPLGGYVKLLGENSDGDRSAPLPGSFRSVTIWRRILILLAGPAANVVLAVVIFSILFMVGSTTLKPVIGKIAPASIAANSGLQTNDLILAVDGHSVVSRDDVLLKIIEDISGGTVQITVSSDEGRGPARDLVLNAGQQGPSLSDAQRVLIGLGFNFWGPNVKPVIGLIAPGSAAERGGILVGDQIEWVGDRKLQSFTDLAEYVETHPDQKTDFIVRRDDQTIVRTFVIPTIDSDGKQIGRIGVQPKLDIVFPKTMQTTQRYGLPQAIAKGVVKTIDLSVTTIRVLTKMVTGRISSKNMGGTIAMAQYSGLAASLGPLAYVNFLAMISISIAVFNLCPIPVLDGGQVVMQLVEGIRGSPLPSRLHDMTMRVGMGIMAALICFTFFNDIIKIIL